MCERTLPRLLVVNHWEDVIINNFVLFHFQLFFPFLRCSVMSSFIVPHIYIDEIHCIAGAAGQFRLFSGLFLILSRDVVHK